MLHDVVMRIFQGCGGSPAQFLDAADQGAARCALFATLFAMRKTREIAQQIGGSDTRMGFHLMQPTPRIAACSPTVLQPLWSATCAV